MFFVEVNKIDVFVEVNKIDVFVEENKTRRSYRIWLPWSYFRQNHI
jgi:hypothetical protein